MMEIMEMDEVYHQEIPEKTKCPFCNVIYDVAHKCSVSISGSIHQNDFYCILCDKNLENETIFNDHNSRIHKLKKYDDIVDKLFICDNCDLGFNSFPDLIEHNTTVHRSLSFGKDELQKCTDCDLFFNCLESFEDHKFMHSNLMYSLIDIGSRVSGLPLEFLKYFRCMEPNLFVCTKCNLNFFSLNLIINHIEKHKLIEEGSCCLNELIIPVSLVKELPDKFKIDIEHDSGYVIKADGNKRFIGSLKTVPTHHKVKEIVPGVYHCLLCNGVSCGLQRIIDHMIDHKIHRANHLGEPIPMKYSKNSTKIKEKKIYIRPSRCKKKNQTTTTTTSVKTNLKIFIGNFICNVCHIHFNDKEIFNQHKLTHNQNCSSDDDNLSQSQFDDKPFESVSWNESWSQNEQSKKNYINTCENNGYNCILCHEKFQDFKILLQHMSRHDGGFNPATNEIIKYSLGKINDTQVKIKLETEDTTITTHDPSDVVCFDDIPFKDDVKLLMVFRGIYECKICNELFDDLQKLTEHMLDHKKIEERPAIYYEDIKVETLLESNNESNDDNSEIDEESNDGKSSYFPNKYFENINDRKEFKKILHIPLKRKVEKLENGSYKCTDCNKEFKEIQTIGEHMTTHEISYDIDSLRILRSDELLEELAGKINFFHQVPMRNKLKTIVDGVYECSLCETDEQWVNDFKGIGKHILTNHFPDEFYRCFICKKIIKGRKRVRGHIIKHDAVTENFNCQLCGKYFLTQLFLKLHMEKHNNALNKPFSCNVCSRKFAKLSYLQEHANIHTGVKRHECEICKRKFRLLSNLFQHRLTHTNNKNYVCDVCGMAMKNFLSMRKHKFIHMGIKRFKCDFCEKTFNHSGDCVVHMRLHTGERPFKCDICNQRFIASTNLTKHIKSRHSN